MLFPAMSGQLPSMTVEAGPSRVDVVLPLLVYGGFFIVRSASCSEHHGDTTMVTSIPWWRMMVDGKTDGALRIVQSCGFLGAGRNPCHLGTDAVMLVGVAGPS